MATTKKALYFSPSKAVSPNTRETVIPIEKAREEEKCHFFPIGMPKELPF